MGVWLWVVVVCGCPVLCEGAGVCWVFGLCSCVVVCQVSVVGLVSVGG